MIHRDDIQGLRAVAVLLVALGHAGVPFLGGGFVGVDVFFVLSGFLITGILLAQVERHGTVRLGEFYRRRARRILPAAALTLIATDFAAHLLLNFVRAREAVGDSIWASVFAANTHFAAQGSDYFAQGKPRSPILHFWTLSVEEQFYVVWPSLLALTVLGALALGRRRSTALGPRALLLAVVGLGGGMSLAWSIHSTAVAPVAAYFSTFARAWELALGGALAVMASSLARLPGRIGAALGWAGLGAIACAAVLYSRGTPFPGYAALLPALGAALVIAAGIGAASARATVGRVLAVAPLRYVGDRSYSFYLWHWPVLVIAAGYAGHSLSVGVKLELLCGAFLLSVATYALVENPVRRARGGALLWPASAAVVVVVALVLLRSIGGTAARIDAAAAAVRPAPLVDPTAVAVQRSRPLPAVVAAVRAAERRAAFPSPLTPSVSNLRGDFYNFPPGCTPSDGQTSSRICRLGDTTSVKKLVVIGDSHAQMWMPTILRLAQRDSWVVIPFVKLRCIPRSWTGSPAECAAWYHWAQRHAAALHPDVTLVIGSWAGTRDPREAIRPIAALTTAMRRSSMRVIVAGDSPSQARDPTECLLAAGATMKTCTTRAKAVQLQTSATIETQARKHGVGFVETLGWFCAHPRSAPKAYLCPTVINRTIAYIDRGHISRTYGLELYPSFRAAFRGELFR